MPDPKPPTPVRIPPALLGVGVLVIVVGFGLPLLNSRTAPETPAAAPNFAARDAAPPPAPPNVGASLARLVVALAVVCGLCVVAARWVGRKPAAPADASMTVLASLRVGRCTVHLVRAGERRMLIGTDAAGVKALVELTGPEPEPIPEPTSETLADATSAATPPG